MFSITTIASSTTKPVQIARAIRERLSRLYCNRYMTPNVPMMDRGTAMLGIIVAQTLRKNRKMTMTTSAAVNNIVNSISLTDARIVVVRLKLVSSATVGGIDGRNSWSSANMRSTVSITLAPG